MYIESSAPRRQGDKARLVSPKFPATTGKCLTFWFHMYGPSIGILNVYQSTYNRLGQAIIILQGNKGNRWQIAQMSITSQTPYQVCLRILVRKNVSYSELNVIRLE